MGKKIFISYKYADNSVARLSSTPWYKDVTVRDYVDQLEALFDASTNIYKGESDREDLSWMSEETIWSKLCIK